MTIQDDPRVRNTAAIVAPRVLEAALIQSEDDRAIVLVFFDQAVALPGSDARLDRLRAIVEMSHVDGRWLVSGFHAL
jgi:hypothetical protein